jgi:hypothetical protein
VGVDASVSRGSGQVLALSEGDMLAIGILVAFSKTEINDEDVVLISVVPTDKEVVRLDISMDNTLFMNFLNTLNLFQNHL